MKNIARRVLGLRQAVKTFFQPVVVKNVFNADERQLHHRALLHYLLLPFRTDGGHKMFYYNQNWTVARFLGELLGEMEHVVDVAQFDDSRFVPDADYDLIITHNLSRMQEFRKYLRPGGICVYLSSGQHHSIANDKIRSRYREVNHRFGIRLEPLIEAPANVGGLKYCDALIGFGNEHTASTWRTDYQGPVFMFQNFVYDHLVRGVIARDPDSARRGFLYLGSRDQVVRGLDLLLEVFSYFPGLHLYVAGPYEKEAGFVEAFQKQLFGSLNIHPVGRIDITGSRFMELARSSYYVIYPTCTEGSSGSLLVGMAAGLIPITTPEAGIDLDGCGVLLEGASIEGLARVVFEVVHRDCSWREHQSEQVRALVRTKYSSAVLRNRLRDILMELKEMQLKKAAVQ